MKTSGSIDVRSNNNLGLYEHQNSAVKNLEMWRQQSNNNRAGLLVLPTGGGKTLTATYWLMNKALSAGKKVLWIAHRYSLLEQAHMSFEKVCCRGISVSPKTSYSYRIISGIHENASAIQPDDDILIASKASLSVKKPSFVNWLETNRDNFFSSSTKRTTHPPKVIAT